MRHPFHPFAPIDDGASHPPGLRPLLQVYSAVRHSTPRVSREQELRSPWQCWESPMVLAHERELMLRWQKPSSRRAASSEDGDLGR